MKLCRSCIVCRQRANKSELYRIVSNENNNAILDKEQKINSRGIYICKNKKCIDNCLKMIEKNKLKLKISVDKISLISVIKDVEEELGE